MLVFPTPVIIQNTIPLNGNTVPITGAQAISNYFEMHMYSAYALENITLGETINFGRGSLPVVQINKAVAQGGDIYMEVISYTKMRPDYATAPDGLKLWKCVVDRFPNNPADSGFNW